ncbi:hypothetical protein M569_05947, partial [Genlisea aurea]
IGQLSRLNWWVLVVISIILCISGQACAIVLGKVYSRNGGSSRWMINLVQNGGFPIVLIPYLLFITLGESKTDRSPPPRLLLRSCIYLLAGALCCVYGQLYSFGILYLPGSTFSIICASQLAFSAVFYLLINRQRFTFLVLNSVAVLTLSSALIGFDDSSEGTGSGGQVEYLMGILSSLLASALYALLLSLMELVFEKVLTGESISVTLELHIGVSFAASCFCVGGMFVSGEWRNLGVEMESFENGVYGYATCLVSQVIGWELNVLGMVGLVYLVSSLFSNVISTVSLAVTPLASVVFLGERMDGVLVVAMLMGLWGSGCYVYQKYLDDLRAHRQGRRNDD